MAEESPGYAIGIDVTSYLASRTGVGVCVGKLVKALLAVPGNDRIKLCAVSARREALSTLRRGFPDSEIRVKRLPVRFLTPLVDRSPWIKIESIFGNTDIFHASPLLVPAGKKAAIVVTVWDLTPIRFPEFHLSSNLYTASQLARRLDRADLVIVPSFNTKNDIEDLAIARRDRIRVIPLAADERFRPVQKASDGTLGKYGLECEYILNVGAIEPRKNLPRLFQAFRLLKDRHRIAHKLVVVGPKGWKHEEVFQAVHSLGLTDMVIFTGFVSTETLNSLYNHATLLVYPSLYEGFGLPPLEAMAAGCPVAVSKSSSLPEVVGNAGVYFNPLEVEDIANAIHKVLDTSEFRTQLIESGIAQSRAFSWEKTAEATRQVYREAVDLRSNAP